MKTMKRLLLWLLALCILTASFSSCTLIRLLPFFETTTEKQDETPILPGGIVSEGDGGQNSIDRTLEYQLTQADIDAFYAVLERVETAVSNPDYDASQVQELIDEMTDRFYDLSTQETLAQLQYYLDLSNQKNTETYTFASEAVAEAYERYNEMCKRIDASDAPHRGIFFADWTAEDFEQMREYSQEHTSLTLANEALLQEYHLLSGSEFSSRTSEIYVDLLKNNDAIAELYGYDSYRDYAFEHLYDRDLTPADIKSIRSYVKQYVLPLVQSLLEEFQTHYQSLSPNKQKQVQGYFNLNYESSEALMQAYFETFPQETRTLMSEMLDEGNSVFASSDDAYEGAFTTYLFSQERPVCYFGVDYKDPFTIIHEMGHYLAFADTEMMVQASLDLAEVQSTGNEWLFLFYSTKDMDADVARTILLYRLYEKLASNVIVPLVIDEFEERCYAEMPTDPNRFDAIMTALLGEWGGGAWFATYIGDMQSYWRYVVLDSPAYYVSYAISMLTSIGIYIKAENTSYETARDSYLGLVTNIDCDKGYLGLIHEAGLMSPTNESLYRDLYQLVA